LLTAHVVAHTHWDREWYHPFVRFRQRLVTLIDELLDHPPGEGESFLLDGQGIVLEDYLEVRPERAAELSSLLHAGRLEAGPWYVLADELIPSGEALVRNLLLGRRVLRRLRASSPPVLYCPDSFGHPAALPTIAAGFELPVAIVWRGFGGRRWPASDTVRWQAESGESIILYHLPASGYEYASALPVAPALAEERWSRMRDELSPRSATSVVLLPNGADHHARQQKQHEAVRALKKAAKHAGDIVRASSLTAFVKHVLTATAAWHLPVVRGELRDSYGYTWVLQGTFATRAAQKRANAHGERALLRDAEPWAALARLRGRPSRLPVLTAAWRTLLQAHPHDTLCGCSIDEVAEAMDLRLADAIVQANGIRNDAIAELVGHDAVAARTARDEWRSIVLVRNRAPRPRAGVAIVEIKQFLADVPVGPGSASATVRRAAHATRPPRVHGASALQILHRRLDYDLLESPRHYPDKDLVSVTRAAVWVERPVAGYGLTAFPLGDGATVGAAPERSVRVDGSAIDNGLVRLDVAPDGRVSVELSGSARRINDLIAVEDRVDRGDLYTPSIRAGGAVPELVETRVTQRGPLIGAIRMRWRLRHSPSRASCLEVSLMLVAGSPLVRLHVRGTNGGRNHRLRVGIRTGVAAGALWADAAFGPVHRERLEVPEEDMRDERPPPTGPLHRYVSLFSPTAGATLFSDGLAEYEATDRGELFVTLLRAVGALSRSDLPERPGHAGWPAPTPRAQSIGPFAARLALLMHGGRDADTIDLIERTADDVLLPLEGRTLRSALTIPEDLTGVELEGRGLAFSTLKESEDGEWTVARCVNLLSETVDGRWRFGVRIREARLARLNETPLDALVPDGATVPFSAPPRGVVTILVR
jgi:mannosylglycerate hydrolase